MEELAEEMLRDPELVAALMGLRPTPPPGLACVAVSHDVLHQPADPSCPVCMEAKMHRTPAKRLQPEHNQTTSGAAHTIV